MFWPSQWCLASVNSVFCCVNLNNILSLQRSVALVMQCTFNVNRKKNILFVQTSQFDYFIVSTLFVSALLKHVFLCLVLYLKYVIFFFFSEKAVSVQQCIKKAVHLHFKGLSQISFSSFDFRLHILVSLIRHAFLNKQDTLQPQSYLIILVSIRILKLFQTLLDHSAA